MIPLPTAVRMLLVLTLLATSASCRIFAQQTEELVLKINTSPHQYNNTGSDQGRALFINTLPFGARVSIDGVSIPGRTPLIIDSPGAGKRMIRIDMTGYESSELTITVDPGSVIAVEGILNQTGAALFFQNGAVVGPGELPLPPGGYSLNPGEYELSRTGGKAVFIPVYPSQQWIDGLNIAIPIVTVFAGGLMISEALSPRTSGKISPFTISVLVTDILLAGANAGLHIHRSKWRNDWDTDPAATTPEWAEEDFRRAVTALESGDLLEARNLLDRYAMIHPLDEQTPDALYRSARLAYMQGDFSASSERLSILTEDYPIPSLWDRAWKLSADLYFRINRLEDGLAALDMIYGLGDSVDLESVALKKASVLTEMVTETGERERAVDAWDVLITGWPESILIYEYRQSRDSLTGSP